MMDIILVAILLLLGYGLFVSSLFYKCKNKLSSIVWTIIIGIFVAGLILYLFLIK
jgi:hypothetical protein